MWMHWNMSSNSPQCCLFLKVTWRPGNTCWSKSGDFPCLRDAWVTFWDFWGLICLEKSLQLLFQPQMNGSIMSTSWRPWLPKPSNNDHSVTSQGCDCVNRITWLFPGSFLRLTCWGFSAQLQFKIIDGWAGLPGWFAGLNRLRCQGKLLVCVTGFYMAKVSR